MNVKFRSRGVSARGVAYTSSHAFSPGTKMLMALTGSMAATKVPCRDEQHAKEIIRKRMRESIEQDGDSLVGNLSHARIEKEA